MSAENRNLGLKEYLSRCSTIIEKYPDLVANLIKKWEKDILSQAAFCFESMGYFPEDFEVTVNVEEEEDRVKLITEILGGLGYLSALQINWQEISEESIISRIYDSAVFSITVKIYDRWFAYLGVTCIECSNYSINDMIDYYVVGDEIVGEFIGETCFYAEAIKPFIEIWRKEFPEVKEKAQESRSYYGNSNRMDVIEFLLYKKAMQGS
jgi:hypothetical protein